MKYSLDTSAWIDLGERHYPEHLRVFGPIWNYIYGGIDRGDIISVDWVRNELENKAADWRVAFLRRAERMFLITENIEKEYGKVISDLETQTKFNANKQRERFMKGADPWVIALARNIGQCAVVHAETKSLADYGLGAVCDALGVPHMNLVQFFEENKIGI